MGSQLAHGDARARYQAAIVAFGRRTIARPTLALLMQDAVALVGEILGTGLAGVTEVADGGRNIVTRVATIGAGGKTANPVSHRMPMNPVGSMAAFALTTAGTVVTADLAAETAYQDMFLRNLGVRSALCVPIHLNREPLGALGVYCPEPRRFGDEEAGFVEVISHLLAATIARVHAEDEMVQQRRLAQAVLDSVDAIAITLDRQGRVLRMNAAGGHLLGVSSPEVEGQPFAGALLAPKAAEPFTAFFREALAEKEPRGLEVDLVAKDGTLHSVCLRGALLAGPTGSPSTVLLTGMDRTEVKRRTDELLTARSREKHASGEGAEPATAGPGESAAPPSPAAGKPVPGYDMRSSPRRAYQYRQLIAPLHGDQLPPRNRFFEVICEDISAGGIAFRLDSLPDFKRVVVALGQSAQLAFFTADLVRVSETRAADGRRQFLVGCRFTGRIRQLEPGSQ